MKGGKHTGRQLLPLARERGDDAQVPKAPLTGAVGVQSAVTRRSSEGTTAHSRSKTYSGPALAKRVCMTCDRTFCRVPTARAAAPQFNNPWWLTPQGKGGGGRERTVTEAAHHEERSAPLVWQWVWCGCLFAEVNPRAGQCQQQSARRGTEGGTGRTERGAWIVMCMCCIPSPRLSVCVCVVVRPCPCPCRALAAAQPSPLLLAAAAMGQPAAVSNRTDKRGQTTEGKKEQRETKARACKQRVGGVRSRVSVCPVFVCRCTLRTCEAVRRRVAARG
jgi:hypothetical protein